MDPHKKYSPVPISAKKRQPIHTIDFCLISLTAGSGRHGGIGCIWAKKRKGALSPLSP
jgi:hypothetical protein